MEEFLWDDLRKILHGGQRMAKVHSGEEMLPKGLTSPLGCTNVTDDRQTDDRRICGSMSRTWEKSCTEFRPILVTDVFGSILMC